MEKLPTRVGTFLGTPNAAQLSHGDNVTDFTDAPQTSSGTDFSGCVASYPCGSVSKEFLPVATSECNNSYTVHPYGNDPELSYDPEAALKLPLSPLSTISNTISANNEVSPKLRSFSMSTNSEVSEVAVDTNNGSTQLGSTPCHIPHTDTLVGDSTVHCAESSCPEASKPVVESIYDKTQCRYVSTAPFDVSVNLPVTSGCLNAGDPVMPISGGSGASRLSSWSQSDTNGPFSTDNGPAFRPVSTTARSVVLSDPPLDTVHKRTPVSRTPCLSPSQAHCCSLCGKQYRHGASLRNHMRKHESGVLASKRYRCPHCIYSSQYNRNVTKHIDTIHKSLDAFYPICADSASQFSVKQNLRLKEELAGEAGSLNWTAMGTVRTFDAFEQMPHATGNGRPCSSNSLHDHPPSVAMKVSFQKSSQVLDSTSGPAFSRVSFEKPDTAPVGIQYHTCPRKPYHCDVHDCVRPFKALSDSGYKCSPMDCSSANRTELSSFNTYSGRRNSLQELLGPEVYDIRDRLGDRSPNFHFSGDVYCQAPPTKRQHSESSITGLSSHESYPTYGSYPNDVQFDPSRPVTADVYSFPGPNVHSLSDQQIESTASFRSADPRDIGSHVTGQTSVPFADSRSSGLPTFHHAEPDITLHSPAGNPLMVTPACMISKAGPSSSFPSNPNDGSFSHGCVETPQSTVEQLLCAPDMSGDETSHLSTPEHNKLRAMFYDKPTASDPRDQVAFATNSHLSAHCDFSTNGNDSTDPSQYCSSTPTADSDSLVQGQLNSEADAFFSDLEEILAREQPLFERDTPSYTNSAYVDCKEFVHRSSESSLKSPLPGPTIKLVGAASLLSGDSGLESWSSSSSCSAGTNGTSVWGSQDGSTQMKASPLATTPQSATSISVAGSYNHRQQCCEQTVMFSHTTNELPSSDLDTHQVRPTTQTDPTFSSDCFDGRATGFYPQTPTTMEQPLCSQGRIPPFPEHIPSSYGQPPDSKTSVTGDFFHLRTSCMQFASTKADNEPPCGSFVSRGPTFPRRGSVPITQDPFQKQDIHYTESFHGRPPAVLPDVARVSGTSDPAAASASFFESQNCEFSDRPITEVPQIRGRKSSPYPLPNQNFELVASDNPKLVEGEPIHPYGAPENGTSSRINSMWPTYQAAYNSTGLPYTSHGSTFYDAHNQKAQFAPILPDSKSDLLPGANLQSHRPQSGMGYMPTDRGNPGTASVSEKVPLPYTKTVWPPYQFVNTACPSDYSQPIQQSQASRVPYFTPQMYETSQQHTQLPYPSESFISHQLRYSRTQTPDTSLFGHSQRNVVSYHGAPAGLSQLEQQYICRTRNYYPPSSQPSNRQESKAVRPFKLYCQRLASSLRTVPCPPNPTYPVSFDHTLPGRVNEQMHHAMPHNPCRSTNSADSNLNSWSNIDHSLVGSGPCVPRGIAAAGSSCTREPHSLFFGHNSEADHTYLRDSNSVVPFNNGGCNQPLVDRIPQYTENRGSLPSMPVDSVAVESDSTREPVQGIASAIEPDPIMYNHRNPGTSAIHNDWPTAPLSESVETTSFPQLSIDRQFGISCPSQIIS